MTMTIVEPVGGTSAAQRAAETYLIGRRGSPHVQDYRDFLERNGVPFRWVDIDRNPLVQFLGASASLGVRSLPFFLFQDRQFATLMIASRRPRISSSLQPA